MLDQYALTCDRLIPATPPAVFDGFIAMYGADRPAWIMDSALDLRAGGEWAVTFQPPGIAAFTEHRVITVLDRPRHLGYTARISGTFSFDTTVDLQCAEEDGHTRLTLTQRGFPTTAARDEFAAAWPAVLQELDQRVT